MLFTENVLSHLSSSFLYYSHLTDVLKELKHEKAITLKKVHIIAQMTDKEGLIFHPKISFVTFYLLHKGSTFSYFSQAFCP